MMRFGLILVVIVFVILTAPEISSAAVLYVPDDYSTIQDAINSSTDGDTVIVRDGVYSVYLNITKSITLRSENGSASCILQASTNDDVIEVHADYVNITEFTIRNGNDDGIDIEPLNSDPSKHVNISNNVFYNLYGGIQIEDSNYTTILNNNITTTTEGIYFVGLSHYNLIVNNTISNSDFGINIPAGDGSVIYLNQFINNTQYNAVDCGNNSWNSTEMHDYTYQGNVFTNFTGNYWDDYVGTDANGDGIGDTPYNISSDLCEGGEGGGFWAPVGGGGSEIPKDYYPMLFETLQPPIISNIQESNLTNTSITISWQTDVLSANRILYSLNEDLSSPEWSNWDNNSQTLSMNNSVNLSGGETMYPGRDLEYYTQNPSIVLSGLLPNTTYYYSVYSYRADNTSIYSNSSIRNFTTLRDPKTWYVDDDGLDCPANFTTIQDAVNASISGDAIVVCDGIYDGNITIDKSLNITGVDMPVVSGYAIGCGFILTSSNNIIHGFEFDRPGVLSDCNYGVYVHYSSENNTIRYNNFTYGDWAIYVSSDNNNVFRNHFNRSSVYIFSNHNSLSQNYFENSSVIVENTFVSGGSYNNISDNTFYCPSEVYCLNPLIWIKSKSSLEIQAHNRIENNTITRPYGSLATILIGNLMSDNIISENKINSYKGISIYPSSNRNQVTGNRIEGVNRVFSGRIDDADYGIQISEYSYDNLLSNNTVQYKDIGILIRPYTSGRGVNVTMRNNTLANNSYHLYITPESNPAEEHFDMDIDTSNTIVEDGVKRIYYLRNARNQAFDSSDIGFFACIGCENITLRHLSLQKNSHGILLYNTSDSLIDTVTTNSNHLAGIAIYNSSNVSIQDSWLTGNGFSNKGSGLYLGRAENITVINSDMETNWCYGIEFHSSNNNTVLNSNITDNGPSTQIPPTSDPCQSGNHGDGKGVYFYESGFNTLKHNYIKATHIPKQGSWEGGQRFGIYLTSSSNNTIYNNYFFNHTVNAYDKGKNRWNISKTPGSNIIGGPYLGGNYWHDYAGMDTAGGDGLGDTMLPYNSSGNIQNGGDYHPLTNVAPDYTAPRIFVTSPAEGQTYSASYVYLNVYSPDPDAYRWWYSLNSGANVSFTPNTTISGLANGDYTLTVYVNDTAGNVNSTTVNFTISVSTGVSGVSGGGISGGETVAERPLEEVTQPDFKIVITNPESKQYVERNLTLHFTSPVPLKRASLIIDDNEAESITLPPYATSGEKEIKRLSLGEHTIIVNGQDYYGMKGRGEIRFEVIPLTLGEANVAGSQTVPGFVDDVAFSFYGRPADYILKFEAKGEAEIDVYINEFYRDGIQSYNNLTGSLIHSFQPTAGYRSYGIPISATDITPDVENLISFVSENAGKESTKEWEIRNVSLIPQLPFSFPRITIFTLDKAISENESMTAYVKIDGITNEGDYKAYIYLLTPEGKKLYYPDWSEDEKAISSYYLRTNYYGRLPSTLKFSNFTDGTYILAGKIVDSEFGTPVSLSTDRIYYSGKNSVKLYVNREVFSDGQEVIVEHMITGGKENGSLIVSLENPDGELVFLPMLSEKQESVGYAPIKSDYFIAMDEFVNGRKEGMYILRSNLYNESGELIAEDIQTFEVCGGKSEIRGSYLRKAEVNDISPFVLSRIRLTDFYTLETKEFEFKVDHYGYSISAEPGKYYISGEAYSRGGKAYYIPLVEVFVGCGENKTRNLELEYLGDVNLDLLPVTETGITGGASLTGDQLRLTMEYCNVPSISLDSLDGLESYPAPQCPPVKIILYADITEKALSELLKEYPGDSPETLKRYFTNELRELLLKMTAGRVKIYTEVDRLGLLKEAENAMMADPNTQPDLSEFWKTLNPEYLIGLDIDYRIYPNANTGRYVLTSELVDMDNRGVIVWGAEGINENVKRALYDIVNNPDPYRGYGDIVSHIKLHETRYPNPPRSPSITVSSEKESLTFEEGKDRTEINVMVLDCSGKPVTGERVYFKEVTRRGYIRAEGKASWNQFLISHNFDPDDYVFSTTDSNGVAKAEYILDRSKGTRAGADVIEIAVGKRGQMIEKKHYVVRIAGIGIEIKAEKEEISPRQETELYIYLYREELDGSREPLAGRTILIEKYGLLDGKIVATATDSYGNPVTDENGNAVIRYIAGRKEGVVKVPAVYQGAGYTDAPRDVAFIKVKKEEFVINIRWSEEYSFYSEYHRKRYCGWPLNDVQEGSYQINFEAKIIWDRRSYREESSASVRFTQDTSGTWDARLCAPWWYHDVYEKVGSGEWHKYADIFSELSSGESFRSIVRESKEGDLLLHIDPLRIDMILNGHQTVTGSERWTSIKDGSVVGTRSRSGEQKHDFTGLHYSPAPTRTMSCILTSHPKLYYWPCSYNLPENFPDEYVRLKKLGKNSYGSFHFSYPVKIDREHYFGFYDSEEKLRAQGIKEMHVTVVKR